MFFAYFVDSEVELLTKAMPAELPNNITKSSNIPAKPIPPGQLKCNILKGTSASC